MQGDGQKKTSSFDDPRQGPILGHRMSFAAVVSDILGVCSISKWPTDSLPFFLSALNVWSGGRIQLSSCDEACHQNGEDSPIPNVFAVARAPSRSYDETPILTMALRLPPSGWFR